jgi:hypothetical protein
MVRKPDNYDWDCHYANKLHVIAMGLDVVGKELHCQRQYVKARINGASDVRLRSQRETREGERERASLY